VQAKTVIQYNASQVRSRIADVSGAAVEVDDVLRHRRPEGVIVPAGKVQHDRTRAQRLRRVVPAGMNHADAAQRSGERGEEHAIGC